MIPIKNDRELEAMRRSNRLVAQVREELAAFIQPGLTTLALDDFARERIESRGATCAFKGYRGYPGHICVSVNEEVVHGVPGPRVIQWGDIVSIDVGVFFEGFVGDTAITVEVGETSPENRRLMEVTQKALAEGIAQAVEGHRLGDVSHAIERTAQKAGFAVVREFVGHGIGREMHEDPQIPNFGKAGRGPKLKAGMTLAIEPMINRGGAHIIVDDDGWTVRTADGLPSAHFEHTVAVGKQQAEILTVAGG